MSSESEQGKESMRGRDHKGRVLKENKKKKATHTHTHTQPRRAKKRKALL